MCDGGCLRDGRNELCAILRVMKIGIDASRATCELRTGVETYSSCLLPPLVDLITRGGDEAILYSPRPLTGFGGDATVLKSDCTPGQKNKDAFEKKDILERKGVLERKNVHVRVMRFPRLWTQVRLSMEMRQNAPDVLFVPSHTLPVVHPARAVITIHDTAFMEFPEAYSLFSRTYLRLSARFAVKRAKKIIVPSGATRDQLVRFFSCPIEKISVVPHGFSPDSFSTSSLSEERIDEILSLFGLRRDTPFVFYIGRLESKKNVVRLIDSFMCFHEKFPEWQMVLAGGRGEGFSKIMHAMSLHEKDGSWDCILMPGHITDEERAVLYRFCQFVAFPSLSEGFGFPLLEAAWHRKRVLASDISALREVALGSEYFVDPLSVEAMANGMDNLARSDDREVNNYDWEKISECLCEMSWEKCAQSTLDVLLAAADVSR